MNRSHDPSRRRPILVVLGLLMAGVIALGVTGMVSSIVIAEINRGMATAVNQSGTLRMQSYRIGMALADERVPWPTRRAKVERLAAEYEQRLISARLTAALPRDASDPVRLAYERVRWRWTREMRPTLRRFSETRDPTPAIRAERLAYLDQVGDFVDDIHTLVRVLEERAEHHIDLLRWIQVSALVLMVALVLVSLVVVRRRVVTPLGALLDSADRARRGDFSGQTGCVGGDELGRVGAAMNLMTEGLSRIYGELEERVADKTRDLERSNRSLSLLYRTSRALDEAPLSDATLGQVIADMRRQLGLAGVAICLRDDLQVNGRDCIGTAPTRRPGASCPVDDCGLCAGPALAEQPDADATPVASFAIRDPDRVYGTLRVVLPAGGALKPWQQPLLEALAGHLANALHLMCRLHEGRRLALHEERGILARELHDSLAQSLSYLKIQAARLEAALRDPHASAERNLPAPAEILSEIREGIGSAYRQLRELLTTFRLRIDGRGLANALAETAEEFRRRGDIAISLDDRLPPGRLSPNEEVHVMQIIREALSNVVRHAEARHCRIQLDSAGEEIQVSIADDGKGLDGSFPDRGHYGLTIMRERAQTLGGGLQIESKPEEGTRVSLVFRPRGLDLDG
jgi:two-component system, NarL family, nitrate/nitrite sensor histidine kinase NarX